MTTASPTTTAAPVATSRGPVDQLTRRLEAFPLRLRLIAIMLVLLTLALTLTASATAVLMRRELTQAVDADLLRAWPSVAQQAYASIVTQSKTRLPSLKDVPSAPRRSRARRRSARP